MKKVLALTLAVVLAFGMMGVGFAKAGDRVNGVAGIIGASYITFDKAGAGTHNDTIDLNNMVVAHNDTIRVYLYPDDFTWPKDKDDKEIRPEGTTKDPMTTSNLNSVSVKASWKKGGEYFLSPELKYSSGKGTCYIELKTRKGIVLTGDKDIDGKIVITYKGNKSELELAGLVKNQEVMVYDDDSVWVTASDYVKADEFVKALEFNFETDDVSVFVNVFGGKKYYIWIEEDVLTKDEELIAKYDSIEAVFHAYYSNNVNIASTYTTFNLDDKYYVYNQDGKYLGTSTDKLPMAGTYYLSSKKLDSFGASAEEEDPGTAPEAVAPATPENPAGGGDDAPANANDNPGTGSNGFMNIAVVAGLVALAAGAVSMKK